MNIDTDIEDADATGGNGAKSYSFSYSFIGYLGASATFLYGINNSGEIAGQYVDAAGLYHGFVDINGSTTNIDCVNLNAAQTLPWGINNAGEVVGSYIDQRGGTHGFLYQAGFCTNLDYSQAVSTTAVGINDDDQISGYFTDSLGAYHGFLYQAGNFGPPINYPGATGTDLHGINGDAQIAGGCPNGDCPSFLYYQGTFSYPPLANIAVVNNNEQITGTTSPNVIFVHEGSSITLACPGGSSVNPVTSPSDFILNSQTSAKVALVGTCTVGGILHGFLATSQ